MIPGFCQFVSLSVCLSVARLYHHATSGLRCANTDKKIEIFLGVSIIVKRRPNKKQNIKNYTNIKNKINK